MYRIKTEMYMSRTQGNSSLCLFDTAVIKLKLFGSHSSEIRHVFLLQCMTVCCRQMKMHEAHDLHAACNIIWFQLWPYFDGPVAQGNEQTAELTSLRDSLLREPLKFQVFRCSAEWDTFGEKCWPCQGYLFFHDPLSSRSRTAGLNHWQEHNCTNMERKRHLH